MWIDDGELLAQLGKLAGTCIVVTKHGRAPKKIDDLQRLHDLNDRTPGIPVRAFPGPLGHVEDVIGFTPQRLRVASANLTAASRCSLEFGYWTEDGALLQGAERFLLEAMAASDGLDRDADSADLDLALVDFDDVAMADAIAEMDCDDDKELS